MTDNNRIRVTLGALEQAGAILLAAVRSCPDQYRDELASLAFYVGNLAAKIDPYQGEETDPGSPFGSATERGD